MTRVLVAVDAPVVRAGLADVLDAEPALHVAGWATAPLDVAEQVARTAPDVVLTWFDHFGDSLELARALAEVPVVAVGQVRREEDLVDALRAGVRGLLDRRASPAEVVRAVLDVSAGRLAFPAGWERTLVTRLERAPSAARTGQDVLSLTPRETDVVVLLLDGYSVKQVANRLGIALQTTKNHIHHVMVKTGSTSRVELVKWAMRHGFRSSAQATGPASRAPDGARRVSLRADARSGNCAARALEAGAP